MNLNEFQEAWKNEEEQAPLNMPQSFLKKANQPLDNIRSNMKNELYYQLFGILLVGVLPLFNKINGMDLVAYYALFLLFLAISLYYFSRFYELFKRIHNYNDSLKDNLYEVYYEIRLHIEMYKSFSFLLIPFIFLLTGILIHASDSNNNDDASGKLDGLMLIYYVASGVIITLIMLFTTNYWVKRFYGKYAKQIRNILDELKE